MEKMIAVCGLDCAECLAFIATQKNDDNERKAVSEKWSKQFHVTIPPEAINCSGCHSTKGELFSHCKVCEIRKCGMEKNLGNCAHCDEFPCDKVSMVIKHAPAAKVNLEAIRSSLS